MQASTKVRAARKKMQIDRLAAKGDKTADYLTYYANQPLEKVRAAQNEEKKAARGALRDATENLAVAEITGEGLKAAQESVAIASLVVHKLNTRGASAGSSLTGA